MKKLMMVAVATLTVMPFAAFAIAVPQLPPSEYADTEVSTNCPFAVEKTNARHLRIELDCISTPSNNVQVAFGRDANANGVLEVAETGFAVGWDCGEWVLRDSGTNEWCAASVTTNARKSLVFDLGVSRAKPRRVSATENGEPLAWDMPGMPPGSLFCNEWDTLRLTVRGIDPPEESVRAQVVVGGFVLSIR